MEKYTIDYDEQKYSESEYYFHIYEPAQVKDGIKTSPCIAMCHSESDALQIVKALNARLDHDKELCALTDMLNELIQCCDRDTVTYSVLERARKLVFEPFKPSN